jgi:hypothetical protein
VLLSELLGHPAGIDPEQDRGTPPAALALHVKQGSVPGQHRAGEGVSELLRGSVTDLTGLHGPFPGS